MIKQYYIYDSITKKYVSTNDYEQQPVNSVDFAPGIINPEQNAILNEEGTAWIDCRNQEDIQNSTLALLMLYPELNGLNYKLLQLDNLEMIEREAPLSNKGLKGEKKYYKEGQLIWSSQKKYWFEPDAEYTEGFVRTIKLFSLGGTVLDSWNVKVKLSSDDRQLFLKQQRELIFEYFKSQQTQLFNLLYAFFSKEINDYVMVGGNGLATALTEAASSHEVEMVRQTLTMEVPTQSGGTVTVLQGILAELV